MVKLIAIHEIRRNPTGRMVSTGRYDQDDNLILCTDPDVHSPGSVFELEEGDELSTFLEIGAVRFLDEAETALDERQGKRVEMSLLDAGL